MCRVQPLTDRDFDARYYATGCGRPYGRDAVWTAFFGGIADRIVTVLRPGRTLDAGCAWGLLVEALRARGVDAYGFDVSSYAIGQVAGRMRNVVAEAGYQRDPAADVSFVTPWAALYRRMR
jgi:2-polyprenyl-3-methyl-5-hydroxy-6-metoxy-1,4-benzoquinol methylase